ncbi:14430_t:CDS:2 [Cetraspora pellucida]|uniref:14430_t:CDS:1 n=1 Tax=Cetraspora pellucida TaxID=1433469 RepID=A0A9N9GJW6_9GLOM|nr:14430_t:CDS:2 [Cetraspora pellucida]
MTPEISTNRLAQAEDSLQIIKNRFCKLQQDLALKEDYIKYLEKEILIQDEDLDPLRQEISNLKEQLEKALQDSKSQENYDKIDILNEKILILYKNSNDTIEMAQPPESPRLSLPENQAMIQNNRIQQEINNIRQYFQSPVTIASTINGIVDYLNIIFNAGNRFERLVLDIYSRANTHAINAENQAYEAHRTQHSIFKSRELDGRITICMQKRQISKLLLEKFALGFKNRRTQQQLQEYKTDEAITTHLLNLTKNRYSKWNNKCKTLENDLLLWSKWKNHARNFEQLINNLQAQILLLYNNPPNMATVAGDLTSIAPLIAEIPNYSRQILPDEWYQGINKILTLIAIIAAAFNDALRAEILKSKMTGKYTNIPVQHAGNNIDTPACFIIWLHHKYQTETVGTQQVATQRLAQEKFLPFDNPESYEARICSIPDQISQTSAVNIQNKLHSDSSDISQAELDSIIKSQLALVLTTSIQSSQLQKTQALQSQQKQPNFSNYLRVSNKYMPERPPDGYGVNSEKFIHCDLINPTSSASQIIESLANNLYKKVSDMFSAKPVQSMKNIEVNFDKELADHMGKLSINKALSKGFEAGVHAISKSHKINKEPKSRKRGGSKQTVLEQTIHKIIQKLAPEISNSDEDETLDDPIEINFVCQKEPDTGIVTIPCKIKHLKIPAMILDSGAETEIITEDIVKCINGKIDRSVKYDLSGIATIPIESIGIVCNLLITLTPDCTIYEDFVVMKYSKPMLIFSNQLLKKYECVIDWNNDKMKIHHNRKEHIFSVTMYKVKNKLEVNYATATQDSLYNEDTITSKPLVSNEISQEVDSDKDDSIPFDEWCASADFSLDSVNLTLAKQAPKVLKKNA